MRRTGLAHGQGMKLAVSSAPKARKVFVSHPRTGRRALLGIQATHLPCAKWSFWWVIFREQTWVTSRERRRRLGRTVLLTNRLDWSAEQVVAGYSGQQQIERVFRGLKDGEWLGWGPMYHWTDSKIRIHAFYCM